MILLIKKFSTSLIDNNSFYKKLNYIYFLPFLSNIKYEKSINLAALRGKYIGEKFLTYFLNSKKNIKNVLKITDKQAEKITENLFKKSSIEELEACILAQKKINFLKKYVDIKNINKFRKALSYNKGIIIAIVHVGSFASALCKTAIILDDIIFNAISWDYQTSSCEITKKFLKKKIIGMKYFFKGDFFFVGRINPKKLYNKLLNKEVLIMAIDAPLGKSQFVPINFLNRNVKFPISVIKLAHKTNSLILPFEVYRDEIKIIGNFKDPIEIKNDDYQSYLQTLFSLLEKNIYYHPDEFFYWTSPTSWSSLDKL